MKVNTFVKAMVTLTLASQAAAPAFGSVAHAQTQKASQESRKESAALSESQKLALNLLITATILDQKGYQLAAVDPKVINKYETIKKTYLGAVPTSSAGGIAYYVGGQSLKTVEFLFKPLTALARGMYYVAKFSSEKIGDVMMALKINVLLDKSADVSEKSFDLVVKPILNVLITKNTVVSSGSSAATGVFATSVFFMMNGAQEAMSFAQVRNLLGQDDAIRGRVDQVVESVSPIFNLDPVNKDKLKIAIYDEVLRQAVENKFSDDASKYNLDVVALMLAHKMIDTDTAKAVQTLRKLAPPANAASTVDSRKVIADNVEVALSLAAVLEQQINSGTISDARTLAEVQRMLGSLHSRLALIGFNLQR